MIGFFGNSFSSVIQYDAFSRIGVWRERVDSDEVENGLSQALFFQISSPTLRSKNHRSTEGAKWLKAPFDFPHHAFRLAHRKTVKCCLLVLEPIWLVHLRPLFRSTPGCCWGRGTVIVGLGWCLVRHATLFVEEFEPLFLCWVITRSCPERIMIN